MIQVRSTDDKMAQPTAADLLDKADNEVAGSKIFKEI